MVIHPTTLLRGALLAAFFLTLAGCARPFAAAPLSSCGPPSALDPHFHLAVAGSLVFAAGLGTTHAIVGDFAPGIPAKVGITALHPLTTALALEGWDCATGQRLRFWYHPGSNPFQSVPVSSARLADTGDLVAVLLPDAQGMYPGYMLFTHSGLWKVVVRQGGQVLRSVVFDVLAPPATRNGASAAAGTDG